MALLHTVIEDIPALTLENIRLLKRNDIFNVVQYLQEDLYRIGRVSKISARNQIYIYRDMMKLFRAPRIRGSDILDYNSMLPTRISQLDDILDYGLARGEITEVCGLAGSGKSQLAFTLCANVSFAFKKKVIYIDTKGDFSAQRVRQIIEGKGGDDIKEIALSFERIKVVRITSMHSLISFLHKLVKCKNLEKTVDLIIIDSLPALMLQFLGEKSKESLGLLNQFVNVIRHISKKNNLAVIVINVLTRWMEAKGRKNDYSHSNWTETRKPTLGRYWQYIPHISLDLEKSAINPLIINLSIRTQPHSSDLQKAQLTLSSKYGIT